MELQISNDQARRCEELARRIVNELADDLHGMSTVAIERATLRAMGVQGCTADGISLVNVFVDALSEDLLQGGVALAVAAGIVRSDGASPTQVCQQFVEGEIDLQYDDTETRKLKRIVGKHMDDFFCVASTARLQNQAKLASIAKSGVAPYVVVATGDVLEDARQVESAVREGAKIINSLRSSGQSLLDYVPDVHDIKGFGGTFATKRNFRVMNEAVESACRKHKTTALMAFYGSGLCMPEFTILAAQERLGVVVNDCMYGVLFRGINPIRSYLDQKFSRKLSKLAGFMVHTGEDNILRVADLPSDYSTSLAFNFINKALALKDGICGENLALGASFEYDPGKESSLEHEIAFACLGKQLFSDCKRKYMPPTRHLTGDIFANITIQTLYNFVSCFSGQDVHFPGMMSEGYASPMIHDRACAIQGFNYVRRAVGALPTSLELSDGCDIQRYADKILKSTVELLESICGLGLFRSFEEGVFLNTKRPAREGHGYEGVFQVSQKYFNPLQQMFEIEEFDESN